MTAPVLREKATSGWTMAFVMPNHYTIQTVPKPTNPLADEKIGKGEPKSCEMEQYQDGTNVFEMTRIIDGQAIEIAIKLASKLIIGTPWQMFDSPIHP